MLHAPRLDEDVPADPLGIARLARVTDVDLAAGMVTLALGDPDDDDGEVETIPLAWLTGRAGALRIWCPPSVGEQVLVLCPEGDIAQGVIAGSLWCDAFPPPDDSTSTVMLFGDGGRFAYDPNVHACTITLPAGATFALDAAGGISFTGPVEITGDVTITGDVSCTGTLDVSAQITTPADVVASGKSLTTHRHTDVRVGVAVSGPPQ